MTVSGHPLAHQPSPCLLSAEMSSSTAEMMKNPRLTSTFIIQRGSFISMSLRQKIFIHTLNIYQLQIIMVYMSDHGCIHSILRAGKVYLIACQCLSLVLAFKTTIKSREIQQRTQGTKAAQNPVNLREDLKVDTIHTCGSSCCRCCSRPPAARHTSSGWTEREEFLRLWTARQCPGCGGCTRTSQT